MSSISVKLLTVSHLFLYRVTCGLLGNRIAGMPVMLLTTTGAKSGEPRTIPITYIKNGDDYILTASNGGSDKNPSWVLNLKKNPIATIRIRGLRQKAVASQVDKTMKTLLWAKLISSAPMYTGYQERTARDIPMLALRVQAGRE